MAPPRKSGSRPGRALAALVALIVIMLIGIVGANAFSPGKWHNDFKIRLGLDLSSGTQVTLRAVTQKGKTPPAADMKQAVAIIQSRVNSSGTSGVSVQQQGASDIAVTVPGAGSQQVINLVSTTAQLRIRPILLEGSSTAAPSTTPSPNASGTKSATPTASPSPTVSTKAYISRAAASPSPQAKASGSASAKASATPSPSATSSAASSAASTAGDPSAVNAETMKLFEKMDCSDLSTWKQKLGYTEPQWDDPNSQIVSCGANGAKYVLGPAVILGTDVTSEAVGIREHQRPVCGQPDPQRQGHQGVRHADRNAGQQVPAGRQLQRQRPGAGQHRDRAGRERRLGRADPEAIPGGNVQISNIGGQTQATQIVNELKYGALPLSFKPVDATTVTAQLGRNQLDAGLLAGAIGLLLVVIYSFLYYRGLGIVSVSSLAIAALIGYLGIVLLSKYESFTLSLAGIAGLIVAIGITADSFVVFFERLRDEVREGRSLRGAVESGWKRARRTILVSDTVSFLAALLLYIFAIGDVRGFAFTLGLTTIIDVIVVFLFTKPMVTLLARTKFFGQGHKWSGLDPARLGARAPWRSGVPRRGTRPVPPGTARTPRATSREA